MQTYLFINVHMVNNYNAVLRYNTAYLILSIYITPRNIVNAALFCKTDTVFDCRQTQCMYLLVLLCARAGKNIPIICIKQ